MSILDEIEAVGRDVEELTEGMTNYGGCCGYAAAMGARLRDLGYQVEIITNMREGLTDPAEARYSVSDRMDPQEWHDNGVSMGHVGVRALIDDVWYCIDSEVVYEGRDGFGVNSYGDPITASEGFFSPEEALSFYEKANWNPDFPRRLMPKIRNLIATIGAQIC